MGDPAQGQRVREARIELGLTQDAFAELIGLSSGQSVSKIERGVTGLDPDRARMIAAASSKPISFFLDASATPSPANHGETAALFRQAVALLEEIRRRLPPEPG